MDERRKITMRTQSPDTSPEAERVQIELIRQASSARLFGLVRSLSQTLLRASRKNIHNLHPELSKVELDLLFVELYYGKELAERVRAYLEERKCQ
jgi:hypothetical protein